VVWGAGTVTGVQLAGVRALGGFFDLPRADGNGWAPLAALLADQERLRAEVDGVQQVLAARAGVDLAGVAARATASVVHLGLVARLVAPALASLVLTGSVPDLSVPVLRWRRSPGEGLALGLASDRLGRRGIGHVATSLSPAFAALSVSPLILRGNAASALVGAAAALVRTDAALEAPARAALDEALAPLAGALAPDRSRLSCCLALRLPGGLRCGDCVLPPR